MPALDRNLKVACPNCGTKVSKQNLSVHRKRCSVGALFRSQCPNFSTKSQNDLNYHIARKHGAPKPAVAHICIICKDTFTGSFGLRQHKSQVHGDTYKTSDDSSPFLMVSMMRDSKRNYVPVKIFSWTLNSNVGDITCSITQWKH